MIFDSVARPLVIILFVSLGVVVSGVSACLYTQQKEHQFQGWIEGHFVFVSPEETGRIETLFVRDGDTVTEGAPLFALDDELQRDAVIEAEAALANAKITFNRARGLLEKKVGTEKSFDDAEAALRTAQAHLNSARTRLARRSVSSPVGGAVQEVYFRVGEMVQSARPIVSILPPGDVRVRFFVPQAVVPKLKIGEAVSILCDGCENDLIGKISFISNEAEFTPPVIYSPDERSRLVFRIEARPDQPDKLRVGQPVSVVLLPEGVRGNGQS